MLGKPFEGCVLVSWATITKYHKLDGLNNRDLVLTVLEDETSKIKMLAESISGEDTFWLVGGCLLAVSPHGGEHKLSNVFIFSYKDTNPIRLGPQPYNLI